MCKQLQGVVDVGLPGSLTLTCFASVWRSENVYNAKFSVSQITNHFMSWAFEFSQKSKNDGC